MTVAVTFSRELNIGTLINRAYNLAGLMPADQGTTGQQWVSRSAMARDLLQTILDELEIYGVFTKQVKMTTLALTAGTFRYSLPANVWDVEGDGAYIAASETDLTKAGSETPVMQIDREAWQVLGAKNVQSLPTLFWVDQSAALAQVVLWPIPNEAGTIRFQMTSLRADVTDTNATVDAERFWTQYLMWELAHHLAIAANKLAHGQYLSVQAQQKKQRAIGAANQNVASQIVLEHSTGWSN